MIKSHLCEFVAISMSMFDRSFLISVLTLVIKILRFITGYLYRSKQGHVIEENGSDFSVDRCRKDDRVVCEDSTVFLSSGIVEKELHKSQDCNRISTAADVEDTVFLQSEYQFMSGKNVIEFVEEPNTVNFSVHEMFLGSDDDEDDLIAYDQSLDSEISQEFDKESDPPSFVFKLLLDSCSFTNGHVSESENIDRDKADNTVKIICPEYRQENEESNSADSNGCGAEDVDFIDDLIMEDRDFSYEVELIQGIRHLVPSANQESATSIESSDRACSEGIDQIKPEVIVEEHNIDQPRLASSSSVLGTEGVEDLDEEFIEFELMRVNSADTGKKSFSNGDVGKTDEFSKQESLHSEGATSVDGLQENKNSWDSDSDDENEPDALSEHQNLVQQMKMELKHCRNGGLPTISEECETFKVADDLKPLKIDEKFEYKDVIEEIQKFYKSYAEKMRKLDILNYQTLHAISFLQLKDSEVFTAGKKKSASAPFNLPKIWPYKVKRIYADPMQKSIMEMNRDLDLVYVGQLCLSWEILCWLCAKAQELMEHDPKGNHSYNRVAEEFQQFQVLLQRFMEDEPFQGPRIQNYVKSRCVIRSLLQVPTIKDDCLKDNKERRDGADAISLESLSGIIRESMLIFKEFLRADKSASNIVLKGIQGTKVGRQDTENSELLMDIITTLQKKDKRIREQMRSQKCIVKKWQKQHKDFDEEMLNSQVELSLVSRVLSLSRLTTDQLVWCQNKLSNISFVRRTTSVHVEPSFLLFPC